MLTFAFLAITVGCYAAMRALEVLGAGRVDGGYARARGVLAVAVLVAAVGIVVGLIVDLMTFRPLMQYLQEIVQVIQDVGT